MIQHPIDIIPPKPATTPPATKQAPSIEELVRRARQSVPQGGGSRAMAFHLGCLRALHDRGVLEHVSAMSTVSGGSIIGAMYAYSSDPFEAFDERVVSVLRRGLIWPLVRRLLSPVGVTRSIATMMSAYDNLGTAPLEPGRDVQVSTHAKAPNVIIACDAGVGVSDGGRIPYWWPTRMSASFETIFRRVQNDTRNRLHRYAENGDIRGFILAYLGQQDSRLPWMPGGFVKREDVVRYPTNFSAMSEENLRLLTTRGEQLMRCLISHYLPEL